MKKIISFIIAVVLCFCFIGCSKNPGTANGVKDFVDGKYSVEATLTGGSGKAKIEDATVVIENGNAVATIVWSSPYYEYMIIDETKYEPIQKSGNSTFKIPVTFDEDIKIQALTVAMSQPHLIDYTLRFDSDTLKGE